MRAASKARTTLSATAASTSPSGNPTASAPAATSPTKLRHCCAGALFEAAQCAARRGSPDHAYYLQVSKRIDHNRACLSVARKLCRRAHHILRELGDDALTPINPATTTPLVDAA